VHEETLYVAYDLRVSYQ